MATMNPDEEINEMLDILDALLDGIEPENHDDHGGPANKQTRHGAQSTGSLRSPACSSRSVTSPTIDSCGINPALRFARTEPGRQNTRRCAYC
jgi:hypothetical protein